MDKNINDKEIVKEQLGRIPRGMIKVVARGIDNEPLVVETAPWVDNPKAKDGKEPFPTTFYLTSPKLSSDISTLESAGVMKELQELITPDSDNYDLEIAKQYKQDHYRYIDFRDKLAAELKMPRLTDVYPDKFKEFSAGGMPNRVKCLHALVAAEYGIGNVIGRMVLKHLSKI
ncbi:MAG: DUF501 domain-containing protein [Candidatus Ancillula sp.]|nr:DUF501 domain-containing protein [Candidatus Ancillula sp.]